MHAILTKFSKIYMCVSKRRVWLMCFVSFFHQPSEPWAPCQAVSAFADQHFHICWAFPLRCFAHPSTWQSSHQGPSLLAAWTLAGNISTWISTWIWTLANTKARAIVLTAFQVMLWPDCKYILRVEIIKLFFLPFVFSFKVPDKYFTILLDYLQGLQGGAREKTVQKAEAFMKEFDGSDGEDPSLLEKCERIRQVLQLLSWEYFCVIIVVWWREGEDVTYRGCKGFVKIILNFILVIFSDWKYLSCLELMK